MTLPTYRRRRAAAALSLAALVGAALAPAIVATPAAATPTCQNPLPYGAAADADLLRLHLLDLQPLGLKLGPVADVRLATTGTGMAADAQVASAAAARDVEANLLGLELAGLVPAAELGRTVYQQAPPTNAAPATHTGLPFDLGLLRVDASTIDAHATWDEAMRCGTETGRAAAASASLLDAALLPQPGGKALVRLPGNLASGTEVGLVANGNSAAARATAAISLTDLEVLAGQISVKVISQPTLTAVATGKASSSSVSYQAPVLEISGPGIGTERLDTPGTHLDLVLPTPGVGLTELAGGLPILPNNPLEGLLQGLDPQLSQITTGAGAGTGLLDLAGAPALPGLQQVTDDVGSLAGLGGLSILRLSLGDLEQEITDHEVTGSAASLRLQVLASPASGGYGSGGGRAESAVLDLGIGLLEVAAQAPEPLRPPYEEATPTDPPGSGGTGGGCGEDCPEGKGGTLPVTGSAVGLLAGAGALLAIAGRFLLLLGRRDSYLTG